MSKITEMAGSLAEDTQNNTNPDEITPIKTSQRALPVSHENLIVKTLSDNRNKANPAHISLPVPGQATSYQNKFNISAEALDWLGKKGYDPARLDYLYSYNPDKDGPVTNIFNRIYTPPKTVDEKKVKQARIAASIGDALGILSQMWSAGKGAHVKPVTYEQTASGRLNNNKKEMDNLYEQRLDRYNNQKYSAALQDYSHWLNEHDKLISKINQYEALQNTKSQSQQNGQTTKNVRIEDSNRIYQLKK